MPLRLSQTPACRRQLGEYSFVAHDTLHFRDKEVCGRSGDFFREANTVPCSHAQSRGRFVSCSSGQIPAEAPGLLAWATRMASGETKATPTPSSLSCLQALGSAIASPECLALQLTLRQAYKVCFK